MNGNEGDNTALKAGAAYAFRDLCKATTKWAGPGCIDRGTPPGLYVDPPVQGSTCRLFASSLLPRTVGVVVVGIPHSGLSLGSGCTVYFDLALPTIPVFFITNGAGEWVSPDIAVSGSVQQNCAEVALQAAFASPSTAPLGMALSNGVIARIGN